jgi:cytochrome b
MTDESAEPRPSQGAGRGLIVRVWDAPTRLVHGLIVVLIGLAWWTESHDQMDWHIRIGCALLGVVLFRLAWGVFGGPTARFASFVRGPRTVLGYAAKLIGGKGSDPAVGHNPSDVAIGHNPSDVAVGHNPSDVAVGHNPMGGWSVVALLGVMAAEIGLGLFCVDVDGLESGPLADRVSFHAGRTAAHWHRVLFNVLLALIALHLCAIAFYAAVRRENLIGPMLTGRKRLAGIEAAPAMLARRESTVALWISALLAAGVAVWAAYGFKI